MSTDPCRHHPNYTDTSLKTPVLSAFNTSTFISSELQVHDATTHQVTNDTCLHFYYEMGINICNRTGFGHRKMHNETMIYEDDFTDKNNIICNNTKCKLIECCHTPCGHGQGHHHDKDHDSHSDNDKNHHHHSEKHKNDHKQKGHPSASHLDHFPKPSVIQTPSIVSPLPIITKMPAPRPAPNIRPTKPMQIPTLPK
eukprot:Awhi_evm2s2648